MKPDPKGAPAANDTPTDSRQTVHNDDMALGSTNDSPRPEFLTVAEAAALLRLNLKTMYAAIQDRQIPGVVRVGRAIRIRRDALLAWGADSSGPALGACK
jgi:excisionase family DNA binding protein